MGKKTDANAVFKEVILRLAKAGLPRPGSLGPGASYLIECDHEGAVGRIAVSISDTDLGQILDDLVGGQDLT